MLRKKKGGEKLSKRPSPTRGARQAETPEEKDYREAVKKGVYKLGGDRPFDPNDVFDYGIGGIVKKSVYFVAAAAFAFDIYINSPLFDRKAPPPIVSAWNQEMEDGKKLIEMDNRPEFL